MSIIPLLVKFVISHGMENQSVLLYVAKGDKTLLLPFYGTLDPNVVTLLVYQKW